jgi:hypothetical protein
MGMDTKGLFESGGMKEFTHFKPEPQAYPIS